MNKRAPHTPAPLIKRLPLGIRMYLEGAAKRYPDNFRENYGNRSLKELSARELRDFFHVATMWDTKGWPQ